MNNIEVEVLDVHGDPAKYLVGLARLTQRGHAIASMADLKAMFNSAKHVQSSTVSSIAKLPHGTIKRFTPITVAVVGASRRFLAQARTHQVGINFVSGSLQYSNYSGKAQFVVPYPLLRDSMLGEKIGGKDPVELYLEACKQAMANYALITSQVDNDTAGYVTPQGLRNVLIMQGNHQSWQYFIKLRGCNRNTQETQYVTMRIWEELLKTPNGTELFEWAGPECMYGACREGKMSCKEPLMHATKIDGIPAPTRIIQERWPMLNIK